MSKATDCLGERNIDFALRMAIKDADSSRVAEALRRGADPNASIRGDYDYTPLSEAARASDDHQGKSGLAIVRALLAAGANVDERSARGETPLHRAATAGWPQAVEALLSAGADPSAVDEDGQTPLHCAAMNRPGWEISTQAMGLLIGAKADVNALNKMRLSPLHCAAACVHATGMRLLLKAGADPLAAAVDGRLDADFVENAKYGAEAAKIAAFSELKLAVLDAALEVDQKEQMGARKTRDSESKSKIDGFFSDKLSSSHDDFRCGDKAIALPGGQKGPSIDSLRIVDIAEESRFFQDLATKFNMGRLHHRGHAAFSSASMEPNMQGWLISWDSSREEGGMWQEYEVKEKRLAVILPMRGLGDDGKPAPFLLVGEARYDVGNDASSARREAALLPKLDWFERESWVVVGTLKHAQCLIEEETDQLSALLTEADRSWNFDRFLNPRRLEAEEIAAATEKSPPKKRPTLSEQAGIAMWAQLLCVERNPWSGSPANERSVTGCGASSFKELASQKNIPNGTCAFSMIQEGAIQQKA